MVRVIGHNLTQYTCMFKEWLLIIKKHKFSTLQFLKLLSQRHLFNPKSIKFSGIYFRNFDNPLYSTIKEVFIKEDYNPKGFPIFPGDTVVDIGAHIGVFVTYAWAKGANEIYGYEAEKNNFKKLKNTIKDNNITNVNVYNKAISSTSGTIEMIKFQNSRQNSIFLNKNESSEKESYTKVQSVDINTALKDLKQIDFLKMDVEGAEYDIIESCSKETFSKIKIIVLEYHLFENNRIKNLEKILSENYSTCIKTPTRNKKFGYIYCRN